MSLLKWLHLALTLPVFVVPLSRSEHTGYSTTLKDTKRTYTVRAKLNLLKTNLCLQRSLHIFVSGCETFYNFAPNYLADEAEIPQREIKFYLLLDLMHVSKSVSELKQTKCFSSCLSEMDQILNREIPSGSRCWRHKAVKQVSWRFAWQYK